MTMRTGTHHFVSYNAAVLYYRDYGYADVHATVRQKINEGEIICGSPPDLKPGQKLVLIDKDWRYAIDE